jgi:hypothetical protein
MVEFARLDIDVIFGIERRRDEGRAIDCVHE